MNIKINSKKYDIKPLSQLSVEEYALIVDNARYIDLISYISALIGFEIDSANVKMNNIDVAERILLDADIDFSKIKPPNLFEFDKKQHIVTLMDSKAFGKRYMFNIYRKKFEREEFSIVALCVYAIAIALSKEEEEDEIELIFKKLNRMNWQIILSLGFFLSKKLSSKRNFLMIFLRRSIVRLLYSIKAAKMRVTHMTCL